jgi:hypothetical protein
MIEWVVERLISLVGPISALGKDKRELADNEEGQVLQAHIIVMQDATRSTT